MAHFAELDVFYNVVRVVVVGDSDTADENGVEQEKLGKKFLHDMFGGTWIQTSFNTRGGQHQLGGTPFRKNYAGIGSKYDTTRDAFISSGFTTFPSWTLNEDTCQYEAPVAYPDDGKYYDWDEATTNWTERE
tara:strand:+ start:104 stop:499 length:396 start_codon:yes stop_codon:yes gene_type:complete